MSERGFQPLQKHTSDNERFDRSSNPIINPRSIDQVRTSSPRSPDMPHMHIGPSAFRPIEARNTPLNSHALTRYSGQSQVNGQLENRVASRASITVDWLGPIMTKIVDEASERDRRRDQREHEERMRAQQREENLTEQALQLMKTEIEQVKAAANQRAETDILRKEKELLERESEMQKQFAQKELQNVERQKEFLLQHKKEHIEAAKQREKEQIEAAKQREKEQVEAAKQREKEQIEAAKQREREAYELLTHRERENMIRAEKEAEFAAQREDNCDKIYTITLISKLKQLFWSNR